MNVFEKKQIGKSMKNRIELLSAKKALVTTEARHSCRLLKINKCLLNFFQMAEGGFLNLLPIEQFIQCIHCYQLFRKDDVDYWPLLSIKDYLNRISYTAAGCEYLDEYYFDTANVPCEISCPHCGKDFETFAQVTARPVWNDEEMLEGRVPDICSFEYVIILQVSMSLEKTTSIEECFKCDNNLEISEDVELNIRHDLDSFLQPCSIILKIIAQTKMNKGFCYLGLDESTGRIFRPIFNTDSQKCNWPKNEQLEFGMLYIFSVVANPDEKKYFTPLPHCNEDMIVNGFTFLEPQVTCMNSVYQSLLQVAKSDVCDVFKDIILKSYVEE